MALNLTTLTPASVKAKNVATEEYVDTGLANIDVSGDIAANNDVFAQKLGYVNYAAMVNAANSGQTVINGGYINTNLIAANTITANQINTTGLLADNIKAASSIQGNSIFGSYIEGATISGAIIKTSYLDLNGELEVLTDWESSIQLGYSIPIDYNGTIIYKLPTISSISDGDGVEILAVPGSSYSTVQLPYGGGTSNVYNANTTFVNSGGMYSYDSYSTTSTLRARKVRPTITFPNTSIIVTGGNGIGTGTKVVDVYLFGVFFGTATLNNTYGSTSASFAGYSGNTTFSVNGITFQLEHKWYEIPNPIGWSTRVSYANLKIVAGTYTITFDWRNQKPLCEFYVRTPTADAGSFPPFNVNNL